MLLETLKIALNEVLKKLVVKGYDKLTMADIQAISDLCWDNSFTAELDGDKQNLTISYHPEDKKILDQFLKDHNIPFIDLSSN